jgi:uncharacterized membrane protein
MCIWVVAVLGTLYDSIPAQPIPTRYSVGSGRVTASVKNVRHLIMLMLMQPCMRLAALLGAKSAPHNNMALPSDLHLAIPTRIATQANDTS